MEFNFFDEEKQFRRIMLDIEEISPRKLRKEVVTNMQLLAETRDSYFPDVGYAELIDYLYRLRGGVFFRDASKHKLRLMQEVLDWLEAAYLHRAGKPYTVKTAEMRYKSFIEEKNNSEMAYIIHERKSAWKKKHPLLFRLKKISSRLFFVFIPLTPFIGPWIDVEPFKRLMIIGAYLPIAVILWGMANVMEEGI